MLKSVRRLFCVAAVVGVIGMPTTQAQQVEWGDGWAYGQTLLFNFEGQNITEGGEWVYQLVADIGNNTDFAALIAAGQGGPGWAIGNEHASASEYLADDDIVIGQNVWIPGDGYMEYTETQMVHPDTSDILWSTTYYFRWFNAESQATATQAGVIHNPGWVFPAFADPPPQNPDADLSYPLDDGYGQNALAGLGSHLDGEGWQSMPMVPEPGSFVLFGFGLLTVAARRKLRKSA